MLVEIKTIAEIIAFHIRPILAAVLVPLVE